VNASQLISQKDRPAGTHGFPAGLTSSPSQPDREIESPAGMVTSVTSLAGRMRRRTRRGNAPGADRPAAHS
jgi:hypothetical protein